MRGVVGGISEFLMVSNIHSVDSTRCTLGDLVAKSPDLQRIMHDLQSLRRAAREAEELHAKSKVCCSMS